jgi:hypothetical protein
MAAWVDASAPGLPADDRVDRLAHELGLGHPTGRVDRVLRRAIAAAAIDAAAHRVSGRGEPGSLLVDDPLPRVSAADEQERAQEQAEVDQQRDRWLNDERPPHY